MNGPPTKRTRPDSLLDERRAQEALGSSRDRRTGPVATQAEESGFCALVAEMERRTGLPMLDASEPKLAPVGRFIRSNVTRGKCLLCGNRGGDTINPGDPCPLCGKERGQ